MTLVVCVEDQVSAAAAVTVIMCPLMHNMTTAGNVEGIVQPVSAVIWYHSYTHRLLTLFVGKNIVFQ